MLLYHSSFFSLHSPIRGITQQILNRLGYDFIGIHLRLETDAFDSDFDFEVALDAALNEIKKHKCLESYTGGDDSTFSLYNPPSIYIASGIFSNNVTLNAVETFSSLYRATAVLRAFKDAGFTSIISKSSPMFRDVLPRLKLYAEQHAYSDVLVLQQSYCFIPALPYESSFSHVVERFRQFRGGDYGGVIGNANLFEAWGF